MKRENLVDKDIELCFIDNIVVDKIGDNELVISFFRDCHFVEDFRINIDNYSFEKT